MSEVETTETNLPAKALDRAAFLADVKTQGLGWDAEGLGDAYKMAAVLSRSNLVSEALRGRPESVLLVLWQGRELNISTMRALQHLHVVEGRIGMSAQLMRERVLEAPGVESFEIESVDDEQATVAIKRKSWKEAKRVTFTFAEAQAANLNKAGSNWMKWRRDMLVARATTRCVKWHAPEVLGPLTMTVDELEDEARAEVAKVVTPVVIAGPEAPPPAAKPDFNQAIAAAKATAKKATPQPPKPGPLGDDGHLPEGFVSNHHEARNAEQLEAARAARVAQAHNKEAIVAAQAAAQADPPRLDVPGARAELLQDAVAVSRIGTSERGAGDDNVEGVAWAPAAVATAEQEAADPPPAPTVEELEAAVAAAAGGDSGPPATMTPDPLKMTPKERDAWRKSRAPRITEVVKRTTGMPAVWADAKAWLAERHPPEISMMDLDDAEIERLARFVDRRLEAAMAGG